MKITEKCDVLLEKLAYVPPPDYNPNIMGGVPGPQMAQNPASGMPAGDMGGGPQLQGGQPQGGMQMPAQGQVAPQPGQSGQQVPQEAGQGGPSGKEQAGATMNKDVLMQHIMMQNEQIKQLMTEVSTLKGQAPPESMAGVPSVAEQANQMQPLEAAHHLSGQGFPGMPMGVDMQAQETQPLTPVASTDAVYKKLVGIIKSSSVKKNCLDKQAVMLPIALGAGLGLAPLAMRLWHKGGRYMRTPGRIAATLQDPHYMRDITKARMRAEGILPPMHGRLPEVFSTRPLF